MDSYKPVDPRALNLLIGKKIFKLEKEMTSVEPDLLEIDQLRFQTLQLESELKQLENHWLNGVEKRHLAQRAIGDKADETALADAILQYENIKKET